MLTVYQISCELVSGDLRPVYSDATQLNSTSSGVELSCVAINGPLEELMRVAKTRSH